MVHDALQTECHLICANCEGTGYVVIGWSDSRCPDCDGWGRLLDLDRYELPAPSTRSLLRLIAFIMAAGLLASPVASHRWDDPTCGPAVEAT